MNLDIYKIWAAGDKLLLHAREGCIFWCVCKGLYFFFWVAEQILPISPPTLNCSLSKRVSVFFFMNPSWPMCLSVVFMHMYIKVRSKSSVPLQGHPARYIGMVNLLCFTSTWHAFKQIIHDCSCMSVELLSLTGQGYLLGAGSFYIVWWGYKNIFH